MTELVEDGAGELTLSQPDGPGFFHVSFSDGAVTVGCSTWMAPKHCFEYVSNVVQKHKGLSKSMSVSEVHRTIQWRDTPGPGLEDSTIELPEGVIGRYITDPEDVLRELLVRAADVSEDIAALRLDVGSSVWQWDQFSSSQRGSWRSFGGLADLSNFGALAEVMSYIGDEWVRDNFKNLVPRARRFLREYAG